MAVFGYARNCVHNVADSFCPITNPVLTEPLSDTESGHGADGKPSTDNETEAVSYSWTAFHTVLVCGKCGMSLLCV